MFNILLVDDEDVLREGVCQILQSADVQVIVAHDGMEALELLAINNIDLVISDVVTPNMDGIDFISRVREAFPKMPILSVSGGGRHFSARFGLDAALLSGANDCLTKPFTADQLLEKVATLLALN